MKHCISKYWGSVHHTEYILLPWRTKVKCKQTKNGNKKAKILTIIPTSAPALTSCDGRDRIRKNYELQITSQSFVILNCICGRGGIGRLGGFRFLCESVQVRVLSPAPNIKEGAIAPSLIFMSGKDGTRTHRSGTVRWTVPATSANTGGYHNFRQRRKCKSSPVIRTNSK